MVTRVLEVAGCHLDGLSSMALGFLDGMEAIDNSDALLCQEVLDPLIDVVKIFAGIFVSACWSKRHMIDCDIAVVEVHVRSTVREGIGETCAPLHQCGNACLTFGTQ